LARLLARVTSGIALNEHTEIDGATVFPARLQDGAGRHRLESV